MSNAFQESAVVVARLGGIAADTDKIIGAVEGARAEMVAAARELRAAHSELMAVRGLMLEVRKDVQVSGSDTREALEAHLRELSQVRRLVTALAASFRGPTYR